MKFIVDMNLSPRWCALLQGAGHDASHWSAIGEPSASDQEIMSFAVVAGAVLLTHDLDFGSILANTKATGPSVLQLRSQDVLPESIGDQVLLAIRQFSNELAEGVIVSVDTRRAKATVLPLRPR